MHESNRAWRRDYGRQHRARVIIAIAPTYWVGRFQLARGSTQDRGAVAFGAGLLAGAVVGRTLPALIVGAITCAFIVFVAISARQVWMAANQEPLDIRNGDAVGADVSGSRQTFIYARIPPAWQTTRSTDGYRTT